MKKLSYLIVLTLILGLVLTGCSLLSNVGQVPTSEQSGITYLTKGVPSGLVGLWHFNGNADDSSGTIPPNNGTVYGATYDPSPMGWALSFDGDDYVDCGDKTDFEFSGDFSVEVWVKHNASTSQVYVSKWTGSGDPSQWWLGFFGGNAKAGFGVYDGATGADLVWGTNIADGNWHHVVGVRSGTDIYIYQDSVQIGSATRSNIGTAGENDASLTIGSFGEGNWPIGSRWPFNGLIDEVAVYDRALTAEEVLDHYLSVVISDDEGPVTLDVVANPNPAPVGNTITLTATINDTNTGGSNIASAEYSLDNGDNWLLMDAADGLFDSPVEAVTATIGSFAESQVVEILVCGTDTADNTGEPGYVLLAVYDPTAGFVTGGGWIDSPEGAYTANPSLTGKAIFGFVSKYKKGATVPTGNTEFQFKAGDLNFHSESYDWLVIAGHKAMYKGTGTVNGVGNYGFMLSAIDGDPDMFRIKIWDKGSDTVIYDNKQDGEDGTVVAGGQIVIHKGK